MNRELVVDEKLSCHSVKGILPNKINKTLLNGNQCLTLMWKCELRFIIWWCLNGKLVNDVPIFNRICQYDMHLKQVKLECNTFINNRGIDWEP